MVTEVTEPRPVARSTPPDYLHDGRGIWSWLFTLDHKRIGVMYLVGILTSLLLGGVFALLIRTHLAIPALVHQPGQATSTAGSAAVVVGPSQPVPANTSTGQDAAAQMVAESEAATAASTVQPTPPRYLLTPKEYNRAFTLHGAIMIFLVIIPGIPAALGNFVLPLMLGAKDVAFPRLNLMSFHLWLIGLVFFLVVLFTGGLDTGWTFYTPYSTTTDTRVTTAVVGAFILGFSSIFTGINFIATVHFLRPRGMSWFRMPLFVWSLYATAIIQVLATPVLGITLLLIALEKNLGLGIFDPKLGGDPVLFQHFFWFYSHPAVYIMILPGMGIISELISTFSRKHIFGYRFIAFSSVAIAILGFLVWGHHMFTSGQSRLASMIFSALTFSVSIPSAIKVFNWLATMYKGRISLQTPMCYALAFILLFGIGGLTGLFLGALATDVHLHDTYFVVAHFHYVMFGGTLVAFLGGLHYWWPKMTGKMYNDTLGRLGALLIFLGLNLTFFPQFVLGSRGMPRRYFDYSSLLDRHPEFAGLNLMSTAGAYLTAIGLIVAAVCLLGSLWWGRKAPPNPWGSASLEWRCPSPPPKENFLSPPVITPAFDPYDLDQVVYDPETQGYWVRQTAIT